MNTHLIQMVRVNIKDTRGITGMVLVEVVHMMILKMGSLVRMVKSRSPHEVINLCLLLSLVSIESKLYAFLPQHSFVLFIYLFYDYLVRQLDVFFFSIFWDRVFSIVTFFKNAHVYD